MTWLQVFELLDREYEGAFAGMAGRLEKIPRLPDDSTDAQLRALEGATTEACLAFAHTQRWPRAQPLVAWNVLWRLEQARDFARFVACPELPQAATQQDDVLVAEQILRWLLVDYWQRAGLARRLYRLSANE